MPALLLLCRHVSCSHHPSRTRRGSQRTCRTRSPQGLVLAGVPVAGVDRTQSPTRPGGMGREGAIRNPARANRDGRRNPGCPRRRSTVIVVDASAVVAFVTDTGRLGEFLAATLTANEVAYPSLMPYEVAHVLRRLCMNGVVDEQTARRALLGGALRGQVFEFADLADRVWHLRHNLTAYDASYVALAELIDAPLLTLDTRLAAAPGTRCRFVEVPSSF